jgi:hypothetical protein
MKHIWESREKCKRFCGKAKMKETTLMTEVWIRMDLRETGWGCVEWIQLAQYRQALVNV